MAEIMSDLDTAAGNKEVSMLLYQNLIPDRTITNSIHKNYFFFFRKFKS